MHQSYFGNRNFDAAQTTTLGTCPTNIYNPSINPANNRVTTHTFDNAGNTTGDAEGRTFYYDAENKQKEVRNSQNQIIGQYHYDGDGKRVKKISNAETTIFVYDAGGKLASEYTVSASQSQAPQTSYLTNDTLGSPRVTTDQAGAVVSRRDYRPYGEEISRPNQGTDKIRQKFTGYERDNETELDFAQARFYNDKIGRFNSIDPLLSTGEPNNPQTWHRFAYALNNPLYYTDPTGLYVCKGTEDQCKQFAAKLEEAKEYLKEIGKTYGIESDNYVKAANSISSYGVDESKLKKNNGVFVKFDYEKSGGETTANFDKTSGKLSDKNITVNFNKDDFDDVSLIAHEGNHVDNYKTIGKRDKYTEEFDGHWVQSLFAEAESPNTSSQLITKDGKKYDIWNPNWQRLMIQFERSNAIDNWLADPNYNVTPPKPTTPNSKPKRRKN